MPNECLGTKKEGEVCCASRKQPVIWVWCVPGAMRGQRGKRRTGSRLRGIERWRSGEAGEAAGIWTVRAGRRRDNPQSIFGRRRREKKLRARRVRLRYQGVGHGR